MNNRAVNFGTGLLLALGLVAAACASDEPTATSESEEATSQTDSEPTESESEPEATEAELEPATIEVMHPLTPNLDQEYWDGLVEMFQDVHPQVTVRLVNASANGGGVAAAIQPLIASGNLPDVVFGFPPNAQNYELLLPLTDQEWLDDTLPLPESWQIDGESYTAGVGLQPQSLVYYNKAQFEQAGIDAVPTTLDELTAALGALADAGLTPFQPAGQQLIGSQVLMLSYPSLFAGDDPFYAHVNAGETTIPESPMADVVEAYKEWIEAGWINEDAVTIPYGDAEAQFADGTGAVYPMGSWFAASLDDEQAAQFGVFAAPPVDDSISEPAVGTSKATWQIFRDTEAEEAALAFVEFATTNLEAVEYQVAADGNYSTLTSYAQNPLQQEIQAIIDEAAVVTDCCAGSGRDNVAPPLGGEMGEHTQALFFGGTPQELLTNMQSYWDQNK